VQVLHSLLRAKEHIHPVALLHLLGEKPGELIGRAGAIEEAAGRVE
jgi:hypothetical protein